MRRVVKWIVVMVLFVGATGVFAAIQPWKIVPNESSLTFTATQNDAPITGEFKRFTGNIRFDRDVLSDNRVDITVDMGSLSTSYSDLTRTLATPAWFSTKMFPTAAFKANKFIKTGDNTYQAAGLLTIRGRSLPLKLNFSEEKTISKDKVRVIGSTILKRTDYGVGQGEWASTGEVKDEVIVHFIVTAVKASL